MSDTFGQEAPWALCADEPLFDGSDGLCVCLYGHRERLLQARTLARFPVDLRPLLAAVIQQLEPGDAAAETTLWYGDAPPVRVCLGVLPATCSRHGAPSRADQLTALLRRHADRSAGRLHLCIACDRADDVLAYTAAVTRALPTYRRTTTAAGSPVVRVWLDVDAPEAPATRALEVLRDAVSDAMRWQDMPCAELGCDGFVALAQGRAAELEVDCQVVRGDDLRTQGLEGLWAVGKAAAEPPALVVLRYAPAKARGTRSVVWVGKGVVFDSGGLSLKRPAEMRGMKGDMGGAAAVLAAFCAAARLGVSDALTAVLCIAENAVGPAALRPDDIIRMHAGKTVEVVDTDCEGRLLLADGVSYAAQTLAPDVVVDLATLTDAAPIATGSAHAALVCNDDALERAAVEAGRALGDLAHPLPYLPELARPLLASNVADLCNAASSSRLGASVAAQFIAEHLGPFGGPWLHVDMEGPARDATTGRGTGYGVGLLLRTFGYL